MLNDECIMENKIILANFVFPVSDLNPRIKDFVGRGTCYICIYYFYHNRVLVLLSLGRNVNTILVNQNKLFH